MCGPTIVVRHDQRSGDHVYCRHCGGEARVERDGAVIHATSTGRKGTPEDLQPEVDAALIDSLVRETARFIATDDVVARS